MTTDRPLGGDLFARRCQTRWRDSRRVLLAVTALLGAATHALAQPSPGAAQTFAVVGGVSVTVAGAGTTITGDVGVSPGTSITGIPGSGTVVPPFSTHANDALAMAAQSSVASLYGVLAGTGGASPIAAELGGLVLPSGTYSFATTANIAAGTTLTLSGAGTYIFQVGSAITANVGSNVVLINGASPCNVFWQVTSAATLDGVTFAGTVVAQAAVTLGVGATLSGRALTTAAGSVTMAGGNTVGGCSGLTGGCPVITLAPATLPNGTVGAAYSQTITGSGGAGPYTFDVTAGTLPAGLTLTSAGVLAGTPTAAGTSTVTVRATDANGCVATRVYTIIVAPVCPVITLAPATLPNGAVGVAYTQTITGSGGAGPYTFDVTAGTLPAGLTLTSAGVLAGTPTAAGTSTVTVRATDTNGCVATRVYTIVVAATPPACPVITLAPVTLPDGTVGVAYSQTITGSGGVTPYTFDVTAGTLPAGLTLTSAGALAGTPTAAGSYTVTVRATDANGCVGTRSYTFAIALAPPVPPVCPTITLAPSTLPNAIAGIAYTQTITGAGGTAPYSFGVTAGALPPGLILTAAGVISGTPGTAGSSTFTIRGTAADGCFATISYTVIVAAAPPVPPTCPGITLSPPTLPSGIAFVPYNQTIVASGGTAPYAFGVTAGALPAGVTLSAAGVVAGTPTTAGQSIATIRATAADGCFAERSFDLLILTAVPDLPQAFMLLLAIALTGQGFFWLRRRARTAASLQ